MRAALFVAIALAILGSAPRAHAEEVLPLALPPMFDIDDAGTVSAQVTSSKRAIAAQWDAASRWLGLIGAGAVIDDMMKTYSLQIHAGFGRRFRVFEHDFDATGKLRVTLDARIVGELLWTQPGKDDSRDVRLATDGGVGVWFATPKHTHAGLHAGWDVPIADPIDRPTELVIAASVGLPYGEPDPNATLNEQKAVDSMLTTDPSTWPDDAYRPASTSTDETIVSIGIAYANPMNSMFEQRLMLTLGVLYP